MTAPARPQPVPLTLRVVVGVFAVSALITFFTAFSSYVVVLALPVLVVTGLLTTLAVRLHLGGRVARALAPATAVTLLLSAIATSISVWWILVGLATTAASVVLLLSPSVRAFFAGPAGRVPRAGVSVTLVQVVAFVLGGVLALTTLVSFGFGLVAVGSGAAMGSDDGGIASAVGGLFGMAGGIALASAFFYAALTAFWFWAAQALPRGSRGARVAVSVVCGLNVLPSLLSLAYAPGLTLTSFAFFGAVASALWLPADARRHFGEASLPLVDQWHRAAVTFGATLAANAPTITPAGTHGPAPAPRGPHPAGPTDHAPAHSWPTAHPSSGPTPQPTWTPGPGARHVVPVVPVSRTAPSSSPIPVADLPDDPVTAPINLGRHARPDVGPTQPV